MTLEHQRVALENLVAHTIKLMRRLDALEPTPAAEAAKMTAVNIHAIVFVLTMWSQGKNIDGSPIR